MSTIHWYNVNTRSSLARHGSEESKTNTQLLKKKHILLKLYVFDQISLIFNGFKSHRFSLICNGFRPSAEGAKSENPRYKVRKSKGNEGSLYLGSEKMTC